jgi:hypothetical protein
MTRSQYIHIGLAAMETAKNVRELRGLMRETERVLDGSLQKIDRPARSGKFSGELYITGGVPHRLFPNLTIVHE